MVARIVATGTGGLAVGSGSATTAVATVPAKVADTDVALVIATWQATALETPPSSAMLGSTGWTTLVAPRTDGTMGWAVYAARGFDAGDLLVHQLGAARSVQLYDVYVRDAAAPALWAAGAVNARVANVATTLAAGMALADLALNPSELNLAISVERTTATGTAVTSSPGASAVFFQETVNGTNLTSAWIGQLPGIATPSTDVTITHNSGSANGAAVQLAVPAPAVVPSGLWWPTAELVGVAWLKGIPYLGSRVATELPRDNATVGASGFLVVSGAGGTPNGYVPLHTSVVSLEAVALAAGSGKPPWGMATQMLEQVRAATLAHATVPRRVAMPNANYRDAMVRSARLVTDVRRSPGDPGDFARMTADLQITWSPWSAA